MAYTSSRPPAAVASPPGDAAPYKSAAVSAGERVVDLLSRMTLEEKAAQMMCVWNEKREKLLNADGDFDAERAAAAFGHGHGIGQVGRPSDAGRGKDARDMAQLTNDIQSFFVEKSRLGIPVVFHEECLHGHAAVDATSFPQPIGLAATFDPSFVEALYAMTAREARSRGTHQALTPVVDVARDPRWGRVEETFGEDPHLVATLGMAAVRGFQGDRTFADKARVMATLKHFAAHGQPEGGSNCAPVNVSMRVLRETFLEPFKRCIQRSGAVSVMASYNEIDGVPSHANEWLLRDVLRTEWGFEGFVVSDYYAIWELSDRPDTHGHHVAADRREACELAVRAGVNIELPEPDCYLHLVDLVREGRLTEAQLDDLVAPMLYWKFRMGLFDDPYVDPDVAERIVGSAEHRALALHAARDAITLLRNEGPVLPLDKHALSSVAVIGPNANRPLLGGYSGVPKQNITVLDGIRNALGDAVEVSYAEGCRITIGGSWNEDAVVASDPDEDRRLIAEAIDVAKGCEVIILAIGGNEQTSREAWGLRHLGDRASLDLVGQQEKLAQSLVGLGKPVIVCLFHGRPNSIRWLSEHVPAILECWYLGQECGTAVADAIFGKVNPGGKLPISIPRSVGHLPAYYNHKPSSRRGYLFDDVSPLYPFGFGLSYTTFALTNVRLERDQIAAGESTRVLVDITNTGSRTGSEVVQVYVRDLVSSVTRPVKELKAFEKVLLTAGETRTLRLELTTDAFAFYDVRMKYAVEPGDFAIMVGTSSRDEDLQTVTLRIS